MHHLQSSFVKRNRESEVIQKDDYFVRTSDFLNFRYVNFQVDASCFKNQTLGFCGYCGNFRLKR